MTQTFTENVVIQGSQDTMTQLTVQGPTDQAVPLQTWQTGSNPLAQVAKDGRLQTGDLNPGLGTTDALIEANAALPNGARPRRGLQSLGQFTGALSEAIAWAVHELELLGSGGVSGLQTAIRGKITHNNSGVGGNAELRGGDFQAINQTGSGGTPVGKATGVRGTASNTPSSTNAYLAKAIGVEGAIENAAGGTITEAAAFAVTPPTNSGTLQTLYGLHIPDLTQGAANYALYTGQGRVHFGDSQELQVLATPPTGNPPSGFVAVYPKLVAGAPHLYAKDAAGVEYDLSGSGGSASSVVLAPDSSSRNVIQPSGDYKALVVKNSANQTANPWEVQASSGAPLMAITAGGNMGLGTTSPSQRLDLVYGHLCFTPLAAPAAPTVAVNPIAGNLNGNYTYKITYVTASGETELGAVSATVTPVNQQVNLTLPLGTAGIVTQRKIYRTKSGGYFYFYVATVADNTTTAYTDNATDASLVNDFTSRGNTTAGSFYVGSTLAGLLGSSNTAFGKYSLSNAVGANNTAQGVGALYANTTGFDNTAQGTYALYTNTTGHYSTAQGSQALYANTTGSFNTAQGYCALRANTTGNGNTAQGYQALSNNTTGFDNTAVGAFALNANSGSSNTAQGSYALYQNTNGVYNTAQGVFALPVNTSGWNNVAQGYQALYSNTTGAGNTGVGVGAGYTATPANANTTGSNNTFIGYNAGPGTTTQLTNATALGYNALVSASNALVLGATGTYAVNVGIGVTAPAYKLDVAGSVHASSFPTSSDRRLKHHLSPLTNVLDKLKTIQPVAFDWNDRYVALGRSTQRREIGLIAQEVEAQFPELISHWQQPLEDQVTETYLALDYGRLAAVLLQALKELDDKVAQLTSLRTPPTSGLQVESR